MEKVNLDAAIREINDAAHLLEMRASSLRGIQEAMQIANRPNMTKEEAKAAVETIKNDHALLLAVMLPDDVKAIGYGLERVLNEIEG